MIKRIIKNKDFYIKKLYRGVFNKKRIGVGATSLILKSKNSSIIVTYNKMNYDNCFTYTKDSKVNDIIRYLLIVDIPKFVVQYNLLIHFIKILDLIQSDINDKYTIFLDDFHLIMEKSYINIIKKFKKYTVIVVIYEKINYNEIFGNINYTEIEWETKEYNPIFLNSKNPNVKVTNIIRYFINSNYNIKLNKNTTIKEVYIFVDNLYDINMIFSKFNCNDIRDKVKIVTNENIKPDNKINIFLGNSHIGHDINTKNGLIIINKNKNINNIIGRLRTRESFFYNHIICTNINIDSVSESTRINLEEDLTWVNVLFNSTIIDLTILYYNMIKYNKINKYIMNILEIEYPVFKIIKKLYLNNDRLLLSKIIRLDNYDELSYHLNILNKIKNYISNNIIIGNTYTKNELNNIMKDVKCIFNLKVNVYFNDIHKMYKVSRQNPGIKILAKRGNCLL